MRASANPDELEMFTKLTGRTTAPDKRVEEVWVIAGRRDRYGGEWPRESFQKHGVNYEPAEKTKS